MTFINNNDNYEEGIHNGIEWFIDHTRCSYIQLENVSESICTKYNITPSKCHYKSYFVIDKSDENNMSEKEYLMFIIDKIYEELYCLDGVKYNECETIFSTLVK